MEENRIGPFIRDLRTAKGMTQQQLAEKLGVTDKAVSKWERCVSYPDITLLRELAEALDVSVTELLAGERDAAPPQVSPEVQDAVLDAVTYAETARRGNGRWRFWLFVGLTAACLIAALVLFILYLTLNAPHTQSIMLAIRCVAFGWAVCYPLLRWERRPVGGALAVLTIGIVPFLAQFEYGFQYWVYWIAGFAALYLWAVYFVCRRLLRQRPWRAAGWCFALGLLLIWGIANVLSLQGIASSSPLNLAITAFASAVCFFIDLLVRKRI